MSGYSSALFLLAHEALAGRLRIAPQTVTVTSEPLLPEMRRAFESAWGCRVGNWWGSSEGGPTGVSCYRAAGVHLPDDLLIIEPVSFVHSPVGWREAERTLGRRCTRVRDADRSTLSRNQR